MFHFLEYHADRLPALLRQATDADEFVGEQAYAVGDDLVHFVDVPLYQVAWLFGMHGLEWAWRHQLQIDAVISHVLDMTTGRHLLAVPGLDELLVGVLHPAAAVRAAVGYQAGLVDGQLRRG